MEMLHQYAIEWDGMRWNGMEWVPAPHLETILNCRSRGHLLWGIALLHHELVVFLFYRLSGRFVLSGKRGKL